MAENGFNVHFFSNQLSEGPFWEIQFGSSPLVAAAIHDGHAVRREIMELLAVSETDRLHEEDPHTAFWTSIAPTRIVALRSRFEIDFNRPRDKAVYLDPSDAWGLRVWKSPPSEETVARSLAEYDMETQELAGHCKAGGLLLDMKGPMGGGAGGRASDG